jgi:pyruvate kinase
MNFHKLPAGRTKIVATIGPASNTIDTLVAMINAGMNVARLNFSHGDFDSHARTVANVRTAAAKAGHRVAIMADLPGPKMRLGTIADEPIFLDSGDRFTLTSDDIVGNKDRVGMSYDELPKVVKPGNTLFLNDGFIQLRVDTVEGADVHCTVEVGGELRSHKGLNLPGIDLGASAFTPRDHECLRFAMEQDIDAVSQSFVSSADDLQALRSAAAEMGHKPFVIAKIERSTALENIDSILAATDGIMIARGDLGVEIPIAEIAVVQKELMLKANLLGKPVITATQMLESMTENRRPTRAESTDVANAILDGTDCVMLSGESAMGRYPVESVAMLQSIAIATETNRPECTLKRRVREKWQRVTSPTDLIALTVNTAMETTNPSMLLVPTQSGATARNIGRFRHDVWIKAISSSEKTCRQLCFSYGIHPVLTDPMPEDWNEFAVDLARQIGVKGLFAILVEGPSPLHPETNHRMELIPLPGKTL